MNGLSKYFIVFSMFGMIGGIAHADVSSQKYRNWKQNGVASYYGPGLWGQKTANGTILKKASMTAAHRYLPLGTKLLVLNRDNGKSVTVTVNDRGPFAKHRIIDLAEKPAKILDMKDSGIANVQITTLYVPKQDIMEVASYTEKPVKQPKNHMSKKNKK